MSTRNEPHAINPFVRSIGVTTTYALASTAVWRGLHLTEQYYLVHYPESGSGHLIQLGHVQAAWVVTTLLIIYTYVVGCPTLFPRMLSQYATRPSGEQQASAADHPTAQPPPRHGRTSVVFFTIWGIAFIASLVLRIVVEATVILNYFSPHEDGSPIQTAVPYVEGDWWNPAFINAVSESVSFSFASIVTPLMLRWWIPRACPTSPTAKLHTPLHLSIAVSLSMWVGVLLHKEWATVALSGTVVLTLVVYTVLGIAHTRAGTVDAIRTHADLVYIYCSGYFLFRGMEINSAKVLASFLAGAGPVAHATTLAMTRAVMGSVVLMAEVSMGMIFGQDDCWLSFGLRILEDLTVTSITLDNMTDYPALIITSVFNLAIVAIKDSGIVDDALLAFNHRVALTDLYTGALLSPESANSTTASLTGDGVGSARIPTLPTRSASIMRRISIPRRVSIMVGVPDHVKATVSESSKIVSTAAAADTHPHSPTHSGSAHTPDSSLRSPVHSTAPASPFSQSRRSSSARRTSFTGGGGGGAGMVGMVGRKRSSASMTSSIAAGLTAIPERISDAMRKVGGNGAREDGGEEGSRLTLSESVVPEEDEDEGDADDGDDPGMRTSFGNLVEAPLPTLGRAMASSWNDVSSQQQLAAASGSGSGSPPPHLAAPPSPFADRARQSPRNFRHSISHYPSHLRPVAVPQTRHAQQPASPHVPPSPQAPRFRPVVVTADLNGSRPSIAPAGVPSSPVISEPASASSPTSPVSSRPGSGSPIPEADSPAIVSSDPAPPPLPAVVRQWHASVRLQVDRTQHTMVARFATLSSLALAALMQLAVPGHGGVTPAWTLRAVLLAALAGTGLVAHAFVMAVLAVKVRRVEALAPPTPGRERIRMWAADYRRSAAPGLVLASIVYATSTRYAPPFY
ncbi:hypothetical protein H9P43_000190 [Blastocladiella emersonii ATCC 22665]|nr:hypothetical protein H9P43_000190 [Blastocladiella emersonii ATCC 22665]